MKPFSLNIKGRLITFDRPAVMGIVNATPDSFFEGSRAGSDTEVAARVAAMVVAGVDIIDIGAYSTRPNAIHVEYDEECRRLEGAVRMARIVAPEAILSVDTFHADIARKAVSEWGADIINDISGGNSDPAMFETVAELSVPYVLCHSRGDIDSMHEFTDYEMVTRDVLAELGDRLQSLALLGVNDVIIDPGFGFSKTLEQNYQLLSDLEIFELFHRPILVGVSRKSMITNVLGVSAEEALVGTVALNAFALDRGASILRVHDPLEARQTIDLYQKLSSCHPSE